MLSRSNEEDRPRVGDFDTTYGSLGDENHVRKVNSPVTKMMVENLSPSTTVDSLHRLFSDFGKVRSISLATDIMTGRCGGFGFVHMYEHDTGAALFALDGKHLGGRILRVTIERKMSAGAVAGAR